MVDGWQVFHWSGGLDAEGALLTLLELNQFSDGVRIRLVWQPSNPIIRRIMLQIPLVV